jgi:general secretion pathway protein M
MTDLAAAAMAPRRGLALILLLIALLAGWLLLAWPLIALRQDATAQIARLRETVARLEATAARHPGLQAELVRLQQAGPIAGLFLPASSEGQAAAALQDLVKQAAGRAGGTLVTMQPLPSVAENGFRRVGLKLLLTAELPALQKFLHALEAGRPVAVLEDLYIRARSGQASGPAADRVLEINLSVIGFQRTG